MKKIGGNVSACLQVKITDHRNVIGEYVPEWVDCTSVRGWLDLSSGDSSHSDFNAKVQASTHIFLCDFRTFTNLKTGWVWDPFSFLDGVINEEDPKRVISILDSENARMMINGKVYEVLLIDDPMEMHEHLEIYLKFIGGQNGDYMRKQHPENRR